MERERERAHFCPAAATIDQHGLKFSQDIGLCLLLLLLLLLQLSKGFNTDIGLSQTATAIEQGFNNN
jgi:hypothetical protein